MSHRCMRRSAIAILGVLGGASILASGCGGSAAQGAAHITRGSEGSGAALAAAEALLRTDQQLPSSRRVARPPAAAGTLLDQSRAEPFAHVVDLHVFLSSRAAPPVLLHAFAHDAPPSARVLAGGSSRGRQGMRYWWEEIGVPGEQGALGPRRLSLAIARTGAHTVAVRIDARVAFHIPHSPDYVIPGSVRWLTVQVVGGSGASRRRQGRSRVMQTLTLADPSRVARVAATVNELPVYEPTQPAASCPAGGESSVVILTFRTARDGPVMASVRSSPRGCTKAVSLLLPGKPPYALTGSDRLTSVIEREVGQKLDV